MKGLNTGRNKRELIRDWKMTAWASALNASQSYSLASHSQNSLGFAVDVPVGAPLQPFQLRQQLLFKGYDLFGFLVLDNRAEKKNLYACPPVYSSWTKINTQNETKEAVIVGTTNKCGQKKIKGKILLLSWFAYSALKIKWNCSNVSLQETLLFLRRWICGQRFIVYIYTLSNTSAVKPFEKILLFLLY